jgi:hypothetical protein
MHIAAAMYAYPLLNDMLAPLIHFSAIWSSNGDTALFPERAGRECIVIRGPLSPGRLIVCEDPRTVNAYAVLCASGVRNPTCAG